MISGDQNQIMESAGESGWGMWVWNTMSSILPMDWESDWANENLGYTGHIIHLGIYIDDTTVTFKVYMLKRFIAKKFTLLVY